MATVFTIYGELKADTRSFQQELAAAERRLADTTQAIDHQEKQAEKLGKTTATTARHYEKFKESIQQQRDRLREATTAYQNGEISARKFSQIIGQTGNQVTRLNSRLKDSQARLVDWANGARSAGMMFSNVFRGALAAAGVANLGLAMKDAAVDGVKLFGTLDKLTRFTATLDKNFQSPEALRKFREDVKQLSTEIPHSAESIARASFTVKSAFQNLTQPELIEYLREFGNAATASNTDIAAHVQNVAALAKQYGITAGDLRTFSALIASSFGQALASDDKVAAGFNRILNAAKSTKQPLHDIIAAMSTLQSASSDAEANTTLLQNVLAKLTDPKYIEGFKEMGVSVFDAAGKFRPLNDVINDISKSIQGLSDQQINEKFAFLKDQQAREGFLTLARLVEEYNKQLRDGGDQEAFKQKNELMLNSVEARWQKFVNKMDNFKMSLGALFTDIADGDAKALRQDADSLGITFAANWGKQLRETILKAKEEARNGGLSVGEQISMGIANGSAGDTTGVSAALARLIAASASANKAKAQQEGRQVGTAIGQGMQGGMTSMVGAVAQSALNLAQSAWNSAKSALGIQSPSKVFRQVGVDTAQGFIDGIAAMRASVQASMASMLDISGLKKFAKGDKAGVELLTGLVNELSRFNAATKESEVRLELAAGKYSKLNKEIKDRILLAAKEIDSVNAANAGYEKFSDLLRGIVDTPAKTHVEQFNEAMKDKEVLVYLDGLNEKYSRFAATFREVLRMQAEMKDAQGPPGHAPQGGGPTGSGHVPMPDGTTLPPPPTTSWENFWTMMRQRLNEFRSSLPSLKEALGVNLGRAIEDIGYIFTDAINNWDGTVKGFFKNIGIGFAKMAQQIIQELIRILIYKAILNLIGAFAGGGGSGAGGIHEAGHFSGGFAGGGAVRGPGTSRSDSIWARLSDGEFVVSARAVRKWGVGLFESLNSMTAPLALAGGGHVGGAPAGTTHNTTNSAVNVHMTVIAKDAPSFNRSQEQIAREMANKMKMHLLKGT